jgi:ribosomal protein S18 acetylase RimI-like enzyme
MLATLVKTQEELEQIVSLSDQNTRAKISEEERQSQGFVSWNYSLGLLRKMNEQHPHVIVKEDQRVIGYALVALKEAGAFHPDLQAMTLHLDMISYNNKKLSDYDYYVMGQICVDKAYRGKGVFELLYQKHREIFEKSYDFIVTEISTRNTRSLRAHEKVGFKTIHTYRDSMDEWNVVVWDWREEV